MLERKCFRPFGAGFSRHTGSIVRCTPFLLVTTARERSFNTAPALSNIGSMSPARLSLSTVASPHCRLLFHLARGILAENQRGLSGADQNQAAVIAHSGLEVKLLCSTSGRGKIFILTFPFYRTGDYTQVLRHPSDRLIHFLPSSPWQKWFSNSAAGKRQ